MLARSGLRKLGIVDFLVHQPVVMGVPTYMKKVLGYSPIAYWMLDETTGTVAVCQVSAAQNGVFARDISVMGTEVGIGDGNTAPTFDGTQDVSTSIAVALGGGTGTFMAWGRISTQGAGQDFLLARSTAQEGLYRTGSTRYGGKATGIDVPYDPAGGNDTLWHHYCVSYDGTLGSENTKFYLDGVEQATGPQVGSWTRDDRVWQIGADGNGGDFWLGSAAHVALFSGVLTPAQILDLATVWR